MELFRPFRCTFNGFHNLNNIYGDLIYRTTFLIPVRKSLMENVRAFKSVYCLKIFLTNTKWLICLLVNDFNPLCLVMESRLHNSI